MKPVAPRLTARVLSCLALSAAAACARPAPPGDTLLLLGARSFGADTRAAELLDDMAAATDVLGPARFEIVRAASPDRFADALRGHDGLRAVIALVGDLSVLHGVDPTVWPRFEPELTSRVPDLDALDEALDRLRRAVAERGGTLVLATAPLGMQGRIEVPELLGVHAHLRERARDLDVPLLDLAAHFADLDPAPLFANGIDVLDGYGDDELARAVWTACLEDTSPLPARDDAERAARAEARALQAIHRGQVEAWPALIDAALTGEPATARHATRRAALRSLRDGLPATAADWAAIEPAHVELPALAIGRSLAAGSATATGFRGAPSKDPVARQLLGILDALAAWEQDPTDADAAALMLARADELLSLRPDRLESWLALQVVSAYLFPGRDLRVEARDSLARFPRTAVSLRTVDLVFDRWPQAVDSLPALLAAARPFAQLKPSGPLLESARRRAALGHVVTAAMQLEQGLSSGRYPRAWRVELTRLREH